MYTFVSLFHRVIQGLAVLGTLCAVGCGPQFVVRVPETVANARRGPAVQVLPIRELRTNPQLFSVGYAGFFQAKSEHEANSDTPPAKVLTQALSDELVQRGLNISNSPSMGFSIDCKMPLFQIRYRNYAGWFSSTDGWGYLDLFCRITSGGQVVFNGPIYARHHRVFYHLDTLWEEVAGVLIQQVAAILNRQVFKVAASSALLQRAASLLSSKDADERHNGAYLLGVTGDVRVIPMLLPHLQDSEAKVRRSVIDALGTLGAAEVLPILLSRYDQEDGNVQWATLKTILQTGDPQGFAWLRAKAPAITADTLREIVTDVLEHDLSRKTIPRTY